LDETLPVPECAVCKRFFKYCFECSRLYCLNEDICQTPDCRKLPLRETFWPWHGSRGGYGHTRSGVTPIQWKDQPAKRKFDTIAAEGPVFALAYRYGKLIWCEDRHCMVQTFSRFGPRIVPALDPTAGSLLAPAASSGLQRVPLIGSIIRPSTQAAVGYYEPQALVAAHGAAYVLTDAGAEKLDLATLEDVAEPRVLPGQFFGQLVTPRRWFGFATAQDELRIFECERDGLWEVESGETVPGFPFEEWRDAVAVGERLFLGGTHGIFEWHDGRLWPVWADENGGNKVLAVASHDHSLLALTGGSENRLHRFQLNGTSTAHAGVKPIKEEILKLGSAQFLPRLVVAGHYCCLWDNANGPRYIKVLDLTNDDLRHLQTEPIAIQYPGGQTAQWAIAGTAWPQRGSIDNIAQSYLIYALSDGDKVSLQAVALPVPASVSASSTVVPDGIRPSVPWALEESHAAGMPLSAALADGFLVLGLGAAPLGSLRILNLADRP